MKKLLAKTITVNSQGKKFEKSKIKITNPFDRSPPPKKSGPFQH